MSSKQNRVNFSIPTESNNTNTNTDRVNTTTKFYPPQRYLSLNPFVSKNSLTAHSKIFNKILQNKDNFFKKKEIMTLNQKRDISKDPNNLMQTKKNYSKKNTVLKETFNKEEIKDILYKIFMRYSKFSVDAKENIVTYANLLNIYKKTELDKYLDSYDYELSVKSNSKNHYLITFKEFGNIMTEVCNRVYIEFKEKDFLVKFSVFINDFIIPLYEKIEINVFEDVITNNILDYSTIDFMIKILPSIKILYEKYFYFEVNKFKDIKKIKSGSLDSLLLFCHDFEIIPQLVSKSTLIKYYYLLKPQNLFFELNLGVHYTISNFSVSLFNFSIIYNKKYNYYEDGSNLDLFMLFLERLESTKGFEAFEKRFNFKLKANFSLFPFSNRINENLLDGKNTVIFNSKTTLEYHDKDSLTIRNNFVSINNKTISFDKLRISNSMKSALMNQYIFDFIKKIFQTYCKVGEQDSMNTMNLTGWIKFLKESHIITIKEQVIKAKKHKKRYHSSESILEENLSPIKSNRKNNQSKITSNIKKSTDLEIKKLKSNKSLKNSQIIQKNILRSQATLSKSRSPNFISEKLSLLKARQGEVSKPGNLSKVSDLIFR